jgi:hypothetical protein
MARVYAKVFLDCMGHQSYVDPDGVT